VPTEDHLRDLRSPVAVGGIGAADIYLPAGRRKVPQRRPDDDSRRLLATWLILISRDAKVGRPE
jgi:hypothetical protein